MTIVKQIVNIHTVINVATGIVIVVSVNDSNVEPVT